MKTKGEKTPNIQTLFCLFIHEEGGESKSFTKRREKEKARRRKGRRQRLLRKEITKKGGNGDGRDVRSNKNSETSKR